MSGTPRRLVLLPVPGSSRTSPLLHANSFGDKRSVARSAPTSTLRGMHFSPHQPRRHPRHRLSCPVP
ncbi:hypothetical protein CU666_29605 [Pseudomonas syringae pv. actinidifoliorum]|nr:hypothetical protein [Pseudomonas syringae pv. actinidifoliorum]